MNRCRKGKTRVTAMRGSDFDPDGSYTGVCDNIYEKPVQDADDL